MFKPIDEKDIAFLRTVFPAERLMVGKAVSEDYAHDELGGIERRPDVLVEARSAEEISAVLRYATEKNIPVVARGMGTGLVGASVPMYGGIMISLQKMNRILELDETNLVLTVEPGVLLMEVTAFVQARGLFYPPDPGEKTATIGGNISTNAGGMRAVRYGVTRDYVRGLEVVLPTGEIIELGGKVVKNSSGYDLKDLMIGSEGTLGVITKAHLRLLPLPKKSLSLLVPFGDIQDAVNAVPDLMKNSFIPTACEFMEREIILDAETYLGKAFPDKSADAYLLLTYDGNSQEELDHGLDSVAEICLAHGGSDLLLIDTDERKELVWPVRSAFLEAVKGSTTELDECDVVVPKSEIAEFVRFTYTLKEKHNVRIKSFGHAGDGNLHIYVLRDELDEQTWRQKRDAVFDDLYRLAAERGGKVSGEHGIGFAKLPYLERQEQPEVLRLMKSIKTAFDPAGILNPGKVIAR